MSCIMVDSMLTTAFRADKHKFFSKIATDNSIETKIVSANDIAIKTPYLFLLENKAVLEEEFTNLFAVLKKENDENTAGFLIYCYYCASLLEAFHRAYDQEQKAKDFIEIKKQIKARIKREPEKANLGFSFSKTLRNKFQESISELISTPFHLSKIRDYVAYTNLTRLQWLFCRLTLTQGLTLANELQLIENLDAFLGIHTDVDQIISAFQVPAEILNYFSVGLFLARLMIDGGLLIRHTFFPSELECGGETTLWARFKYEFYKRHCNFANDTTWSVVNFLTNFSHLSHIPNPVAGSMTVVFLFFDMSMFLYKNQLAKAEYLIKTAQYTQEINDYRNADKFLEMSQVTKLFHISMLEKQLMELDINWETKQASFYYLAAAAALLGVGFAASMLVASPVLILCSYYLCHLGVVMYISSGAYSQYKEKKLTLGRPDLTGNNHLSALLEYELARNAFISTMIKSCIIPSLIIAAVAIYLPIAVGLAALYVGYELLKSYQHHPVVDELPESLEDDGLLMRR